jgi:hypothetical protein
MRPQSELRSQWFYRVSSAASEDQANKQADDQEQYRNDDQDCQQYSQRGFQAYFAEKIQDPDP